MSWSFRSPKATEALLHVFGICLCFQGVSFPVSPVLFVCIYMLTWGVYYLKYAMLRHSNMHHDKFFGLNQIKLYSFNVKAEH